MTRLCFAVLLAISAASVQAQPAPTVPIQPSVDSAEQRQALGNLTACLAKARPRWARRTLSHPYLSDAQASDAAQALSGSDTCVRGGNDAEITFRTSGLVGSLAEHFLRAEIEMADFKRLANALYVLTPLNVSEDFALCVAARNPEAARDFVLSKPGSAAEMQEARRVAAHVEPCTNRTEQLTVDLQALRALMSIALYRGTTTVLATAARD